MANKLFIGIDSGTQSTKAVVFNPDNGQVLSSATAGYDMVPGLPPGHKEQDPHDWTGAVESCIMSAIKEAGINARHIAGIGVSGQQHGFVALDDKDVVIRPAKLWCDTATGKDCEKLIGRLGGQSTAIAFLGGRIAPGFTASKIFWLKEKEAESYSRLRSVLLPHDYINFWLTGRKCMEYGDASGTGLFDIRSRSWCRAVVNAIDPDLYECLPPLLKPGEPVGLLRRELANRWGMTGNVLVSAGGGDNMMAAIGTGNVRAGIATASLGTSGTIYACADHPVVDEHGLVEGFCDSTGYWLPLACTMNVTVATEMVRTSFGLSHEKYDELAELAAPGSEGLILIPFFEGERTPNLPDATGIFFGIRPKTFTAEHMCRAAMEGVTMGMNFGLRQLRRLGIKPDEIRLTGGGARSPVWRRIMTDIFDAETVCVESNEGAALGAALQALWNYLREDGQAASIEDITGRFVRLNESTRLQPDRDNVEMYKEIQQIQDQVVNATKACFPSHRYFLNQLSELRAEQRRQDEVSPDAELCNI